MSLPEYRFGTRTAIEVDFFAFPRTGNHFLWHNLTGLYDLVFFPLESRFAEEPRQRQAELDPMILTALKLRQDDAGFHPVHVRHSTNGIHGLPLDQGRPMIILIRDPRPTLYSYYMTAVERWKEVIPSPDAWLAHQATQYRLFYQTAAQLRQLTPSRVLLLRYEDLKHDASTLHELVKFVGAPTKLPVEFVFWCCQFGRMTREGQRTFYRAGDNEAWRRDAEWSARLADLGDFSEFGY